MSKIKTYRAHRGIQKSEVEVLVRTPAGKEHTVLLGELDKVRPDKRRKKGHKYVTLANLSKSPRFDLTINLDTNQLSIIGRQGFHYSYIVIDEMIKIMLIAGLYVSLRSRGTLFDLLEGSLTEKEQRAVEYFRDLFNKKIQYKIKVRNRISDRRNLRGVYMPTVRKHLTRNKGSRTKRKVSKNGTKRKA